MDDEPQEPVVAPPITSQVANRAAIAPIHEDLVKEMAMDIGKEIAAYIERMYPKAVQATSQSMLLAVRNHTYNEIMAALAVTDADDIRNRLAQRKSDRRKLKAMYRHIRDADWEKMRAAVDVASLNKQKPPRLPRAA